MCNAVEAQSRRGSARGCSFMSLPALAFAQAGMDFPGTGHALGHAEDGPAAATSHVSHATPAAWAHVEVPLAAGVGKVKFGGGFYCGRLQDIFAAVPLLL